jgi:hypothetical protein
MQLLTRQQRFCPEMRSHPSIRRQHVSKFRTSPGALRLRTVLLTVSIPKPPAMNLLQLPRYGQ